MKKYFVKNFFAVIFCAALIFSAGGVLAEWHIGDPDVPAQPSDDYGLNLDSLLPTDSGGTSVTAAEGSAQSETVQLSNPLSVKSIPELVKNITTVAIGLSGVMALLAFVYGGILYLLAGVNMDFLKKGKEVMKWAIIGLFVIFSSYAVINFVMTKLLGLS